MRARKTARVRSHARRTHTHLLARNGCWDEGVKREKSMRVFDMPCCFVVPNNFTGCKLSSGQLGSVQNRILCVDIRLRLVRYQYVMGGCFGESKSKSRAVLKRNVVEACNGPQKRVNADDYFSTESFTRSSHIPCLTKNNTKTIIQQSTVNT